MATKKLDIKKPADLDLKAAEAMAMKIIRQNKEWLKEMAAK